MRKITIVHVITSLDMGGAERMLSNVVLGMDRARYNNIVVSLKDFGYWGGVLREQGIAVHALKMRPSFMSLAKVLQLWWLLRRVRPDYVQGWMYHANLVALLVGKLAGCRKIYWNIRCSMADAVNTRFITKIIYKLTAWLSRWPHCIINNSQNSIMQHTQLGYRAANWVYIPNGFDLDKFKPNAAIYKEFRAAHKLPENALLIGMFARFDWMKDHATFLHAAGILAAQNPTVYFVLAGTGITLENPQIHALIEAHNLQTRALLLGQIANVHEVLPAMDFITQTSVFGEGFPNVLGEAMACGVPCFATDIGDSLAVLGEVGYAIALQDPQGLVKSWAQALHADNMNLYEKLRSGARSRIAKFYSLPQIIGQYSKTYV